MICMQMNRHFQIKVVGLGIWIIMLCIMIASEHLHVCHFKHTPGISMLSISWSVYLLHQLPCESQGTFSTILIPKKRQFKWLLMLIVTMQAWTKRAYLIYWIITVVLYNLTWFQSRRF